MIIRKLLDDLDGDGSWSGGDHLQCLCVPAGHDGHFLLQFTCVAQVTAQIYLRAEIGSQLADLLRNSIVTSLAESAPLFK